MHNDLDERIDYWASLPFLGMRLACLLAFRTGLGSADAAARV